ncbi:squalene synthase HpnC [bacterium]|nr:squalene synthase HpnC [bacterium]
MNNAQAHDDVADDVAVHGALRAVEIARGHYENFSIAAFFIPKRLRQDIFNIYAFSRSADDIADLSNDDEDAERILNEWDVLLDQTKTNNVDHPLFRALGDTIRRHNLSMEQFHRLLKAFRLDLKQKRWETWADLRSYTACSADPVGRIILELFGYRNPDFFALSDKICTALQLANHWQDVSEDWNRGRIYIPQEDLKKFDVTEEEIGCRSCSDRFKKLMTFEVDRARGLFLEGLSLLNKVERLLSLQLALYWSGGMAALDAIERIDYDVLNHSAKLTKVDKCEAVLKGTFRWVRSSV